MSSNQPEKPEIDFPDSPPPTDLEITDLTEGDGAEAKAGDTVSVHYVGVAHSTGEEFDASYNRGAPLQFRLGVGQVISGWDTGVQGMKIGGRRKLVIPPHLGYGDRGAGGVIKPGETLIFVVDLIRIH
ncbi:MAG TPA: FKBP-type peptidyl-prolyl cis-trans isomerase [Marmoricola sp.]|nr:FKBP-type peptidyl-prolyl cis-trans isomerase [Marmoricola sp.]HNJ78590.1 FKBP-type peptidyl-prolyl cis-trans isomerase [Marmoricola sp.]HNN47891.1 FKBP-type peptidyl-prolyl cis-trans isomerase [Marmoricola sp.]HNO40061.1 FKBP-type peptidyl-prolyl cis-trans isomerase [Marmoricola sp.]